MFRGKLIPSELEFMIIKSIENNEVPFLVALTAGTTVLGAFDPIVPVADICQKYKLWLHVDVRIHISQVFYFLKVHLKLKFNLI